MSNKALVTVYFLGKISCNLLPPTWQHESWIMRINQLSISAASGQLYKSFTIVIYGHSYTSVCSLPYDRNLRSQLMLSQAYPYLRS